MSRIVHAITDSRLGHAANQTSWAGLTPRVATPTVSAAITRSRAKVHAAVETAGARRNQVTFARSCPFLALIAGATLLYAGSASTRAPGPSGMKAARVGLGWPSLRWRQWLANRSRRHLFGIDLGERRFPLVGVVVFVILVYATAMTSRLAAHWWSWSRSDSAEPKIPPDQTGRRPATRLRKATCGQTAPVRLSLASKRATSVTNGAVLTQPQSAILTARGTRRRGA